MKISIYTQIFPRLETFFLEEWIEHHIKLGVDKIYLYDNGRVSTDSPRDLGDELPEEYVGVKWRKKPDADYFLDYTDDEIYEKLNQVVEKFDNQVSLVAWSPGKECPQQERIFCQCAGYLHCITNNSSDWWVSIDPDEYLYSEKYNTIGEFIQMCEKKKRYSLQLSQRVFETRGRDTPTRELYKWGYDIGIFKTIVKSPMLEEDPDYTNLKVRNGFVHKVKSTLGDSFNVPMSEFRFNHYRGPPTSGPQHMKYVEETGVLFDKVDKSMSKFL
jgi:hypothetical protein